MGFYRLEPFGEEWLQAAMVTQRVHNAHYRSPVEIEELLPVRPPRRAQSPRECGQAFLAIVAEHNSQWGPRG